jgi:hypothetical protein
VADKFTEAELPSLTDWLVRSRLNEKSPFGGGGGGLPPPLPPPHPTNPRTSESAKQSRE